MLKPIFTVEYQKNQVSKRLKELGLEPDGQVQWDFILSVARRIKRYVPYRSGLLSNPFVSSSETIDFNQPYALYQYIGKVMVNAKTGKGPALIPGVGYRYRKGAALKATERDLDYDKTKNAQAGPYWDRRLAAAEGDAILEDVANGIKKRSGL